MLTPVATRLGHERVSSPAQSDRAGQAFTILPTPNATDPASQRSAVNRTWVGRVVLLPGAGPPARLVVMESVVELEAVTRRYGSRRRLVTALCEVSLAVPAGQFVAVMGATGSGKSTLLHCAAGLDRPTSGRVRLAGREVSRMREGALTRLRRDRVGFVFQAYNLLSELSVRQNVLLPRRLGGPQPRPVDEVLAEVGLAGLGQRPVGELSGGQRQRVAIARALAARPAVVFADEPTGALDPTTGAQVLRLLRAGVDRDGMTVLLVTHDPAAAAWSDRLVLLRDGVVVADGPTPDETGIAIRLRQATADPQDRMAQRKAGTVAHAATVGQRGGEGDAGMREGGSTS
jgi:putative ABC transport system ATP-binding protein